METKLRELQEKLAVEEADKLQLQSKLHESLDSEVILEFQYNLNCWFIFWMSNDWKSKWCSIAQKYWEIYQIELFYHKKSFVFYAKKNKQMQEKYISVFALQKNALKVCTAKNVSNLHQF